MPSPPVTQECYPYQNEPTWSKSEEVIARTAFGSGAARWDSESKAIGERDTEVGGSLGFGIT
jgi:hypothetical protein